MTLVCKVNILNGIANWKNVTYKIEWFTEGNLLKTETFCGNVPIGGQNPGPCPGATLISQLSGEGYKIGNWVRSFEITPLSLSILVLWDHKANLYPLLSSKQISCNVSAMFTTSPNNVWSPSKAVREPFFAGIQVNQQFVYLFGCLFFCLFYCPFFSHSLQSLPSFFHFSFPPLFNSFFLFCQFLP